MLDPELLLQLAASAGDNAPELNLALAEQGDAAVLLALARHPRCGSDALVVVGQRVARRDGQLLVDPERDPTALWRQFDETLIVHPNAPAAVRDTILQRHLFDPYVVLAAAAHPRATLLAVTTAADWPARLPVLERLWLQLIDAAALPPLTAEAWAQQGSRQRRELVARLSPARGLLATLAHDPAREVRRAVASNPAAGPLRTTLAQNDPAAEVRARAAAPLGAHGASGNLPITDSARFAAALRAMERGGVLTADVAAALLAAGQHLDEEGAKLAARVLPREGVLHLVTTTPPLTIAHAANRGLAAGLCLRAPHDGGGELRATIADVAQALSCVSDQYGILTGKARLAAWFGQGLARCYHPPASAGPHSSTAVAQAAAQPFAEQLCTSSAALGPILTRAFAGAPAVALCRAALTARCIPAALLALAWCSRDISDDEVLSLARRLAKTPRRGKNLRDDELDLDPSCRPLTTLEQVVFSIGRKAPLSPRTALAVVALDSRRVRYILTAMPQWRGPLSGDLLARVLRQRAGALSAGHAEARSRGAENKAWTQRILSDSELAVALAIGHITPDLVAKLLHSGRHRPRDGVGLAHGADARGCLGGKHSIAPLLHWASAKRRQNPVALALWLLLEAHDRPRPLGMISSSLDSLAVDGLATDTNVLEALASYERRSPGRLEKMTPQTARGKAALAGALARAYRALGGLRDER